MSFVIVLATTAIVSTTTGAISVASTVASSGYNLTNNVYNYIKPEEKPKIIDENKLLELEKKKEELEDEIEKLEKKIDKVLSNEFNAGENIKNINVINSEKSIITYDNIRDGTILGSVILFATNPALAWQLLATSSTYLLGFVLAIL